MPVCRDTMVDALINHRLRMVKRRVNTVQIVCILKSLSQHLIMQSPLLVMRGIWFLYSTLV